MHNYVVFISLILFVCCQQSGRQIEDDGITIITNGDILTMDSGVVDVKYAAVKGDQIIDLGSNYRKYKNAEIFDLQGQTLMPGFIEPHVHPSIALTVLPNPIIAPYDWNFPGVLHKGVSGSNAYRNRLKEVVDQDSAQQSLLVIWGYHQLWHGDLSKSIMDEITLSKPVAIIHRSFHEAFLNSAAIELLGISQADFDNQHQVDWEKGRFYEAGWLKLVPRLLPFLLSPEKVKRGMQMMTEIILENGITTIAEPGFPTSDLDSELQTYQALMSDNPSFDLYLIPNGLKLSYVFSNVEETEQFIQNMPQFDSEYLQFLPKTVKLFADGAIYSQLMQLKNGYTDGTNGEWMTPLEILRNQIRYYIEKDYKIHIHANGDLAVHEILSLLSELSQQYDDLNGLTLHHLGYFTADQAKWMKQLGVEASVNPYYVWALSDKYSTNGLHPEQAHDMVNINALIQQNIPVSFHSDFSMAPLSPLTLAWVAVNRQNAQGDISGIKNRIAVYDALKAITIDAAKTIDLGHEIGSIKIGKRANFTILADNPLKVDPLELKDINVEGVFFNGKYQASPISKNASKN